MYVHLMRTNCMQDMFPCGSLAEIRTSLTLSANQHRFIVLNAGK